MQAQPMNPYGRALLDYFDGDVAATIEVLRDDGFKVSMPADHFFRGPSQFSAIEKKALALCSGTVLDIGAGTGSQTLFLQETGINVTAIEISPEAVDIMKKRGVNHVVCGDIFHFDHPPFDTLLLLSHGIGLVGTLDGFRKFLNQAQTLTTSRGVILFDSLDVRRTEDPVHLAYHRRNIAQQRYYGEITMSFSYMGLQGEPFRWLQIDPETLQRESGAAGWEADILHNETWGDYLARLTKLP